MLYYTYTNEGHGEMVSTDPEARAVVRNQEPVMIILLRRVPGGSLDKVIGNDSVDRGYAEILTTGEVLFSSLSWKMADASVDCWLDGFGRGYDQGYEAGKKDADGS